MFFGIKNQEIAAYLPTVHPGDRPLAFHCLGYIWQQFQVGVPGSSCKHRARHS